MKPDWAIRANGKDVTQAFWPHLISIRVRDESKDEADSLTLTLGNSDLVLAPPTQGDELEVLLGYQNALLSTGRFVVDKLSFEGPPDRVTIACKSAAFAKPNGGTSLEPWLVRKTRSWEPGTLDTIAKTIAGEHGVELVAPADLLAMATPHIDQTEQEDTALLYSLIEPRGYLVKVADKKLILAKQSAGITSNLRTGAAVKAVTITKGQVSTYSGEWGERQVYDQVISHWHDTATGQTRYETAGEGSRTFRFVNPAPDQATAQQWAAASLNKYQRQGGKMSLTMPGRVDLQSEQLVTLEEFPYPLSASPTQAAIAKQWILKSVEHVLSRSGFTTSVTGEPFIQT